MPLKVYIEPGKVSTRVETAWNMGLAALSEEILEDCNEYCKVDQRTMRKSSMIHSRPQEGKLVWWTKYAKRQYWEIKSALTPGTTWKWCETAKRKHKARWLKLAERGLKGNL